MFIFKKLVAPLFFPISICLEVLLIGLFFLWFTRRQKIGRTIVSLGTIFLVMISHETIANVLLRPLEYKYSTITDISAFSNVKWVAVLSGGLSADPILSVTDQLSRASLIRLVEGIRIHRKLANSKLILSGGDVFSSMSEAKIMEKLAIELGTDKKKLVLESKSRDTKDQVGFIHDIIGNDKFILVTSASHMARSMALFQSKGMNPIPAPTGYHVKKIKKISPSMFFPNAKGIDKMERVVYEYLGIVWARLKGQISP